MDFGSSAASARAHSTQERMPERQCARMGRGEVRQTSAKVATTSGVNVALVMGMWW